MSRSKIYRRDEFCCCNKDSDYYGVPTFYDDTCDNWEEKD